MTLLGRTPGRSARRFRALHVLPLLVGMGMDRDSWGDEGSPPSAPELTAVARPEADAATATPGVLRYVGTPAPGARLAIGLEGSADPDAAYEWTQFDGPTVPLDDQVGPKIHVTVPPDARNLGFVLTIRDTQGERSARVVIPIEARGARAAAPAPTLSSGAPRADAGDDQIGLVGRRITLNAARSAPRNVAYRWLELSGPKVEQESQDGYYFSFVPTAAGTYRFGLVVASARASAASISEMDEVVVTVGEVPSAMVGGAASGISTAAIDQMLQGPGAAAGRTTLEQAAGAFDTVAARASLYSNFADLSSELMRRLDAIIPTDPNWRRFWSEGVFDPLTQHIIGEMRQTGLDIRTPQGQNQPLGQVQQERLQKLFTSYAREFRARAQAR
ncbi:MAG: hypothetical protein P4L85_15155 [Paludisphaera borealis]|uniref:hypothetical protein n=1 Tax=Paludisphaera borealis TaxID=1387353 RepID=UPI00284F6AD8|nr:hypothetical protein [Paludisphaera borealis]MDR3620688.1 hypothetical protein [Paludisphaera borealis]